MVAARKRSDEPQRPREAPPTTPEGVENQMIAKAMSLAQRQIEEGTASPSLVLHFLKMASSREKLEIEKLKQDKLLLEAKVAQIGTGEQIERLYGEAIQAMRVYQGQSVSMEDDDSDY